MLALCSWAFCMDKAWGGIEKELEVWCETSSSFGPDIKFFFSGFQVVSRKHQVLFPIFSSSGVMKAVMDQIPCFKSAGDSLVYSRVAPATLVKSSWISSGLMVNSGRNRSDAM